MTRSSLAFAGLLMLPGLARAEGSEELGVQYLTRDTTVYVDILDAARERILFTGDTRIEVSAPDGSVMGIYESGDEITPVEAGAHSFRILNMMSEDWDIEITGVPGVGGRVHAYRWDLDALDYGKEYGFSGSFYVLVGGGAPGYNGVIQMRADGLAGFQWQMVANNIGVDGMNGRSGPSFVNAVSELYPIYLAPPDLAAYRITEPAAGDLSFSGGVAECESLAPGVTTGVFSFTSNVEGTWRLICDLNQDGIFDASSDDDLTLSGEAVQGTNEIPWDGTDNGGKLVSEGDYECHVELTVGEFHFVADDIETSFAGLRMFELDESGSRTPLRMFWNDEAVQEDALMMPDGQTGLESSGPDGLDSGTYEVPAQPNVNARSWGAFVEDGKGNTSLLDTYSYLAVDITGSIQVAIIDGQLDTDGDGVTDIEELCEDGTDPYELSGYYQNGCASAPASRGLGGLALAALMLLRVRRREV